MKAIVAVDKNWGIGKDNGLLFNIPEDMKFFRQTTLNKVVVMGSNTLRSFPNGNPLKNRTNIVLSSKIQREDCIVVKDLEGLFSELKKYPQEEIFVIGGAMLYKTLLPYCTEVLVTNVDADGLAQVFFENLDSKEDWVCVNQGEEIQSNGYLIRFTTYKNLKTLSF